MRPVRLEMHGFAAFREPTTVDFAGAEYFALVGPTGAGKSTVIDALTFALYGTVPRWDDRRAVALALGPHVSRGVVRLVFDVRDARYVVARELRRAPRGGVNVKNARLERLVDRDDPDGPTEPLATDSGVTRAVERLLGLSFEHFTACVVLPQGEFAEFLHAKPGDRQAILTRLLGLGVYERIAREANQEAAAAGNRAALLAEQLGAYADATDEAVDAAAARVVALEALAERVAALVPELAAAERAVDEADAAVAAVHAERARLDALAVPAGVAALDGRRRAAQERVDAARARFADAETADDAARKLLADAPARGPLERARREHAELAAALAARPVAAAAHAEAAAAEQEAARAVGAAEDAAAAAAVAREQAAAEHAAADAVVERSARERALLAGVRAPAGLAEAARRQAEAAAVLAAAEARLAAADAADGAARERVAAAPDRGPLEQARRDHAALAALAAEQPAVRSRHGAADRERADAAAAVARARGALATARAHRDAAARGDLAAALRPALVVGEPCPVCAQPVAALPPVRQGADLAAHEAAAARAQADLEAALAAEADAVAAERQAAAERDRVAAEVARLRAALAEAGEDGRGGRAAARGAADPRAAAVADPQTDGVADPQVVEAELAALDAAVEQAAEADAAARAARRARDAAAAGVEAVRRELAAAAAALRAARDPLVPLGAPAAGDDPATGWAALTAWAAAARAEREGALAAATAAAAAAADRAAGADRAAAGAVAALADRRRAATAAARAEEQARGRVASLDERVGALRTALAAAPPAPQVDADLARLDGLEAGARAADAELRAARAARAEAEGAGEAVRREVAAAHAALRAARDPLVPLGAPAVDGPGAPEDDLAAAWAALTGWAAAESAERAARLPALAAEAAAARSTWDAVGAQLVAALAAEGVLTAPVRALPDGLRSGAAGSTAGSGGGGTGAGRPAGSTGENAGSGAAASGAGSGPVSGGAAESVVAAALAQARAGRDRLVERRAEAAGKRAEQARAEEAQQVAKMLGGLLRSDRFPRWLVASALDALVADASVGLAELSGGQFELTHDAGEFLVVDHTDADARRPVKTLSGGETFQASLALALALSAQMSSLAADGAARLDSIFLDEGFGTLDEANLDVVAGTLENLASRGDRMVGVITHVPGLAERVPVRFVVRRDQVSARVEREGS